ncbi:MAG: flagella biosynthesis regulatory protein FliZ, partial [Edwardsiella piscicida]
QIAQRRLRRLDELLTHHVPPSTALSDLSDRWLAALPQCSQNNYRIALRKYQQYLQFAQAA